MQGDAGGELIDHDQHPQPPTPLGEVGDEVVAPDVVGRLWPLADAAVLAAAEAKSPSLLRLGDHLHAFLSPQAFPPLVVHLVASLPQRVVDAGAAEVRITPRDATHLSQELLVHRRSTRRVTVRAPWLTLHATDPPFRNLAGPQETADGLDRPPLMLGAHQFPSEASLRISMSSVWSATSSFSRAFPFSKERSCFARSGAVAGLRSNTTNDETARVLAETQFARPAAARDTGRRHIGCQRARPAASSVFSFISGIQRVPEVAAEVEDLRARLDLEISRRVDVTSSLCSERGRGLLVRQSVCLWLRASLVRPRTVAL